MLNDDYIIKLRKNLYNAEKKNDLLNSLLICERILRLYKDKNIESGFEYTEDMYRIGTVFLNTGRLEKAIDILTKAKEAAKDISGAENLKVNILNNLSISYVNNNEVSKAYKGFKEALKLKKLISGEDNEEYIELLCNTGSVLFDKEDYDKAIYYHFEALNKRKNKDISFADNLNFLGYDFEAKGETENAISYFEQALAIIKTVEGSNSNEYIANAYYLAGVFDKSEQFEKALKYYEIAVEKIKETSNEEHPYYAEALSKMSNVCVKLKNYQRALMLSLKAMTIVKKCMGDNHIYYANAVKSVADIYVKTEDYERAISLYNDEIMLKKKILGEQNDVTIKAVLHLADIYIKAKNVEEAKFICEGVIKNISSDDVMYFECLLGLVRVYTSLENIELLYSVYDMAKTLEPKLSFDDMLKRAFEKDSADNQFVLNTKKELEEEQISLEIPESENSLIDAIENELIELSKSESTPKVSLNEDEVYEQESFDKLFGNNDEE